MEKLFSLKQYRPEDKPPMRFHMFNIYGRIPLGVIINIPTVFLYVTYDILSFVMGLVTIVLACVSVVGLHKKEEYGWKAVMALELYTVLCAVLSCLMYINYIDLLKENLPKLLGTVIVSALIMVYYYKRKLLFTKEAKDTIKIDNMISKADTYVDASQTTIISEGYTDVLKPKYCRKCGNKLFPDSDFCSYCGTQVIKEK